MKVLHLCNRVPVSANDGGNIAMLSIADSLLSQGVHYKMLALNTSKHHVQVDNLPQEIVKRYSIDEVEVDTGVRTLPAFLNLFSSDSYNISRFDSKTFHKRLKDELSKSEFDFVVLESIFMGPYIRTIRNHSKAKIVLRAHNVEHIIWHRLANNEKSYLRRWYLELLARRLKHYETELIQQLDAILPITEEDARFFQASNPAVKIVTIPVGLNMDEYSLQLDESLSLKLFHLGAMDWLPNLEGIEWFLKDCWTLIHRSWPKLELYLAGRGFPKELMDLPPENRNIFPEGEILNAKNYMADKQIMIVPLKSGGGMRVKIIQGMSLGKTIISTTIGAEGIHATDGKDILIANTPQEFLEQISKCIDEPNFCYQIGREARAFAINNYSQQMIGKKLVDFLNTL